MSYRLKKVDGDDDEIADTLHWLDKITFGDTAPPVDPETGFWWLVFAGGEPVGYAGLKESSAYCTWGYLCRVGVLDEHRGHGLQVRLLRAREAQARRNAWETIVTDTTDNIASANSLIKAGYRLYKPAVPWAFPNSLYWIKDLT